MNTGIYKIQSKIKPERVYIGSAVNIYQRWHGHYTALKKGNHHSQKLQRHYNKYGKDDLVFSVIVACDRDKLIAYEQFYIDSLIPFFNTLLTAGSPLGAVRSPETRKKISEAKKGIKWSPEVRERILASPKRRASYHAGMKGKKHKPEAIEKIRAASTGANNGNYGKHHSLESKKKISEAKKGRAPWNKGRPWSDEIRKKIRDGQPKDREYGQEWSKMCKEAWRLRKLKKDKLCLSLF